MANDEERLHAASDSLHGLTSPQDIWEIRRKEMESMADAAEDLAAKQMRDKRWVLLSRDAFGQGRHAYLGWNRSGHGLTHDRVSANRYATRDEALKHQPEWDQRTRDMEWEAVELPPKPRFKPPAAS
jgi:hypothetical protein